MPCYLLHTQVQDSIPRFRIVYLLSRILHLGLGQYIERRDWFTYVQDDIQRSRTSLPRCLGWYIEIWDWFTQVQDGIERDGTGLPMFRMIYRDTGLVYLGLGLYIEIQDQFTQVQDGINRDGNGLPRSRIVYLVLDQ